MKAATDADATEAVGLDRIDREKTVRRDMVRKVVKGYVRVVCKKVFLRKCF